MSRKEEILNKHDTSRKYIEQTCRPELFAAMDQYTKEVAIGYGQWATLNDWTYLKSKGYWVNEEEEENDTTYSPDEHYQLYLNHLNHTDPSPLH